MLQMATAVCRAKTNEEAGIFRDETAKAGKKRRVRTKRGTLANLLQLRKRRKLARAQHRLTHQPQGCARLKAIEREKRMQNRRAAEQLEDWLQTSICETRTPVGQRRDHPTHQTSIKKGRNKKTNRKITGNKHPSHQSTSHQGLSSGPLGRYNRTFGIGTLNARSYITDRQPFKQGELRYFMIHHGIDLIAIQETKCIHAEGIRDTRLSDNSRYLHQTARVGEGGKGASGGLGFLISPENAQHVTEMKTISDRIMYLRFAQQVKGSIQRLHVYNVYAPTAAPENVDASNEFYLSLRTQVQSHPRRDMVLIAGDFNAVLTTDMAGVRYAPRQSTRNLNSQSMHDFLMDTNYVAINCRLPKPNFQLNTFYGPHHRKQRLDYILYPRKYLSAMSNFSTLRPPFASDHKILVARGKFKFQRHRKTAPHRHIDWEALKNDEQAMEIVNQINDNYEATNNLNQDYEEFVRIATEACNSLPQIRRRRRTHPWESKEVEELRLALRALRTEYKSTGSKRVFRKIRRTCRKLAIQYISDQTAYFNEKCAEIESLYTDHQYKAAWQLTNALSNRNARQRGTIAAQTPQERPLLFAKHFEAVLAPKPAVEDNAVYVPQEIHDIELEPIFTDQELQKRAFDTSAIDAWELNKAIMSMSNGKAAGHDNIHVELLKLPGIQPILLDILNQALTSGTTPDLWHTQTLIPVPKKGDLSKCDNYRGIALMSTVAKLYNKVLLYRIRPILDKILRPTQNGFRPKRSTTQQVLALRILTEACSNHRDSPLIVTFIDFTKAFDSINWKYLRAILTLYGIPEKLVAAIMSLYEGTHAHVRTSEGISPPFALTQGVLQGDTLAPYLFIIVLDYVLRRAIPNPSIGFPLNGGTRRTAKYVTDLAYADDIATITTDAAQAQQMLRAIEREALPVGLKINRGKTEAMCFPAAATPVDKISMAAGEIEWVQDFKYLGSHIQSSVKDMLARIPLAWKAATALRRLWKSALSDYIKGRMFNTLIVTILFYGSETWVLNKTTRRRFFNAYNTLLRYCLNIHFSTHTPTIAVYARVPQIPAPAYLLVRRMTQLVHRTLTGPPQAARGVLHWKHSFKRAPHGKRKPSYQDQLLRLMDRDYHLLSPQTKKTRITDMLQHFNSPTYVSEFLSRIPPTLADFESLNLHLDMDVESDSDSNINR